MAPQQKPKTPRKFDEPWKGPVWKHPYFLYIWITGGLFLFLVVMGFLALQGDWIPKR
jgi:hypothetical protein